MCDWDTIHKTASLYKIYFTVVCVNVAAAYTSSATCTYLPGHRCTQQPAHLTVANTCVNTLACARCSLALRSFAIATTVINARFNAVN